MTIHGFGTKPDADYVIKKFLKSFDGVFHDAIYHSTETEWPSYKASGWLGFDQQEWLNLRYPCAIMAGLLKGTDAILKRCINHTIDFYYFDHAYIFACRDHKPSPLFGQRIYRLTKNKLLLNDLLKINENDRKRITKYKTRMHAEMPRRNSKHLKEKFYLIIPPSKAVCKFYNIDIDQWMHRVEATINALPDRPRYFYRFKGSEIPLEEDLDKAKVVISCQSVVALQAIHKGIPIICDEFSMCAPVANSMNGSFSYSDLVYPNKNLYEQWIDGLLASQFTEDEIESGEALEAVDRLHGKGSSLEEKR